MPTVKDASERKFRKKVTDEMIVKIIEMYNNDVTIREIAKTCAVSEQTIYRTIRKVREQQQGG